MLTRATLTDRLRAEVPRLAEGLPTLRLVVLFGSVARDQALSDSDMDLATSGAGYWEALGVGSQLASRVGREPHVVELDRASDLLRYEIARDGILLFERERYLWARFQAESALRYFDLAPLIARAAEGARRRLAREAAGG